MGRRFRIVDVFGERALTGNPLAVVVDSEGLSEEEMLEITRWFNFSETTFLVPARSSEADYGVRIFTLAGELPFAGHPTLGSCHVWQGLQERAANDLVQECGAGLVRLHRSGELIFFEAPSQLREGGVDPRQLEDFASILGVSTSEIVASRWVDNGPGWVGIMLASADDVRRLKPDFSRHEGNEPLDIGVVGFHPEGSDVLYEVRAFFTDHRGEMTEDPVTGSLNASVAQWLLSEERVAAPYVVSQGGQLGRSGRVHITTDPDDNVWVGGRVFDVVDGQLVL